MMTPQQEREQYIRYLEAVVDTMEARLARYKRSKTWWQRALRWIRREAADYRVLPKLRRYVPTEKDRGYFPRKEKP